jgi:CBS domain containing-hemolysin-like protein
MLTLILELIIVILFSALFSGMEIAFVSSNKLLLGIDQNNRSMTSYVIDKFYAKSNNFISSLLVGNNISIVVYGMLMAELLSLTILKNVHDNPSLNLLLETIISTIIIIFTGEFIPKALFRINPNRSLKRFALITYPIYILLYPLSRFTSLCSLFLLRILGIKIKDETRDNTFTKTELNNLILSSIENADDEEKIDNDVLIFQNALDFSSIKIRDCMVPRTEIISIEDDATIEELKALFIEKGISKIIVYQDNIDNITGYIHSSEMFHEPDDWRKCIRQLPIVPETMNANKLMKLFMQQKRSLAVVVDEFGGTSGIVALEDLVEQIFGEIEDEHDTTSYVAKQTGDNEYVFSGRLDIEKANEMFSLNLPESDDYQTIGGLILHQHQSIPKAHDIITLEHFQFKIIKVTSTKIELVKLKVNE